MSGLEAEVDRLTDQLAVAQEKAERAELLERRVEELEAAARQSWRAGAGAVPAQEPAATRVADLAASPSEEAERELKGAIERERQARLATMKDPSADAALRVGKSSVGNDRAGKSPAGSIGAAIGSSIDGFFTEPGETRHKSSWPVRILLVGAMCVVLVPLVLMFFPTHRTRVAIVESVSEGAPLRVDQQCEIELTCRRLVGDDEVTVRCPGDPFPASLPAGCSFDEDRLDSVRARGGEYHVVVELVSARAEIGRQRAPAWRAYVRLSRESEDR